MLALGLVSQVRITEKIKIRISVGLGYDYVLVRFRSRVSMTASG